MHRVVSGQRSAEEFKSLKQETTSEDRVVGLPFLASIPSSIKMELQKKCFNMLIKD